MVAIEKGMIALYMGIFGNIALFVIKFAIGIFSGSIALTNDAFHSLSDFLATVVVLLGYKTSLKPADASHPYGHYKAEPLVGLGVALSLVGMSVFLAYNAILNISREIEPKNIALLAVLISIVVKECMARYAFSVERELRSPAIEATAYDHRSDALSSVVAFFGILAAKFGLSFLDPVAGFIIAMMICYYGFKVGKKNVDMLMDKSLEDGLLREIGERAMEVPGVLGIHRVRSRQMGGKAVLDMHIDVDPNISVIRAHEISHAVQKSLEELDWVRSVLVHVCPYGVKIGKED
ncbi:MAG: ferrous iron efflux protein F [Candidatus Methanolliviera sp. GoM_oil]|nr:MAG: ferrous iron efflux protein F [Candidatus Methanolliviera sp. GoM_oil]